MNADGLVATGQSFVGNNMFSYCHNSPINKADVSGTKPYDLFNSADEAALDFAMCYNAESIEAKQEYGSSIYKVTYYELRFRTKIKYMRFFGSWIKIRYSVPISIRKTKYYYNEPWVGSSGHSVVPNILWPAIPVATVHTHANYDPEYNTGNDNFSGGLGGDLFWAILLKKNMYVATPSGYLKKFTYANRNNANGGITVLSTDIPWDPASPNR